MAIVRAKQRNEMPTSNFAVPGKRKLLIHDVTHARLAWSMVDRTQNLTPKEKASARRKIKSKLESFGVDTSNYKEDLSNSSEAYSSEYDGIDFSPPESVKAKFRQGLKLYEQGRGGGGLVSATISWARKLAGGQNISPEKARKMSAWHARHAVDKRPGWSTPGKETPGYVANLLWGGEPGRAWADRLVRAMEKDEKYSDPPCCEMCSQYECDCNEFNSTLLAKKMEKLSLGEQEALYNFVDDLNPEDAYHLSTALTAVVGAQLFSNQAALQSRAKQPNMVKCYFSYAATKIEEAGSRKAKIPVARLGTFAHPRYGIVDFKQQDFDDMMRNFEDKEDGFPKGPYLRYGHEKFPGAVDGEPAVAYLEKLVQEDDVLWGIYDPIDSQLIGDIETGVYSGASAELTRYAMSKHDGRPIGTLLTAHALTNAPFVPDLPHNQVLSESGGSNPSGGFMSLNLSQYKGANKMNPNEFLSMVDAQLELFSVSADARGRMKDYLSGALTEASIPGTTTKMAGQPSAVYGEGSKAPSEQKSGMKPSMEDPSGLTESEIKGEPSEVYGNSKAMGAVSAQGGTVEMNAQHGDPLRAAAMNLQEMAKKEDAEEMEDKEEMSMFGELLSMFGRMMKGKAKGQAMSQPMGMKAKEGYSNSKVSAQNMSSAADTINSDAQEAQQFSTNPDKGEIDMKPNEVQALIEQAVGAVEQRFSTQLAEKDQKIEALQNQLQTTVTVAQQFSQSAERARIQQRADALVSAGIAPSMVNAALSLAAAPQLAGQQIKLSDAAAPTNVVDAILDMLEKTPAENRINFSQVGQQLSDSNPNPYAEIISRVEGTGK